MLGEKIEKRRQFSQEERQKILKKCKGKCACCGVKLNKDNYTVDHIIPLAKGGTNEDVNLLPLCRKCNELKADKFIWPNGFFMALNDKGINNAIMKHVDDWVGKYVTREYLEEYPMVANGVSTMITTNIDFKPKNGTIIPNLIADVFEVSQDEKKKIKEMTGLSNIDIFDMQMLPNHYFSVYVIKGRVSNKWLALISIQIVPGQDYLIITTLWSNMAPGPIAGFMEFIVQQLHWVWCYHGFGLNKVIVRVPTKRSHDYIMNYSKYYFNYDYYIVPAWDFRIDCKDPNINKKDFEKRLALFKDTMVCFCFKTKAIEENEKAREEIMEKLRADNKSAKENKK